MASARKQSLVLSDFLLSLVLTRRSTGIPEGIISCNELVWKTGKLFNLPAILFFCLVGFFCLNTCQFPVQFMLAQAHQNIFNAVIFHT